MRMGRIFEKRVSTRSRPTTHPPTHPAIHPTCLCEWVEKRQITHLPTYLFR